MSDIGRDPAMEDILASIKRVMAEDQQGTRAPVRRLPVDLDPGPLPAEAPEDVLELDEPMAEEPTLVSASAADASREQLAKLSQLRAAPPATSAAGEGALEAAVREMLRPMLKAWLDDRLPAIVEDLVSREVARITGKSL